MDQVHFKQRPISNHNQADQLPCLQVKIWPKSKKDAQVQIAQCSDYYSSFKAIYAL
jgi:hypothetical protein